MRKCIVSGAYIVAFLAAFCTPGRAQVGPNLVQDGNFAGLFGGPWNGTFGYPNTFYGDADGNGKYVTLFQDEPDMYQYVPTVTGVIYQLGFASRIPQPGELTGNNGPWVVGVNLAPFSRAGNFQDNSSTVWSFFTLDFTAASSSTYLGFTASGQGNPEIDDITLYAVPEPGTMGLLAAGGVCLAAFRARKAKWI